MSEVLKNNPLLNSKKTLEVATRILSENDKEANRLRERFKKAGIYVINLMSSPGSGKTTLLEQTAKFKKFSFGVIEGDLETNRDAKRLEAVGIRAHQITTGTACHLEAKMISKALESFELDGLEFLFIENVGNLVCPASYDLGAHLNVGLLSTPEGDDKVLKYPTLFRCVDLLLISKYDLKDYFDFSVQKVTDEYKKLNPTGKILTISSKDESTIANWIELLLEYKKQNYTSSFIFV